MDKSNENGCKKTEPHENGANAQLAESIRAWMVLRLSEALEIRAEDIDVHAPLISYGLSSIVAFSLTGDLADWLGRELPAALFWDYPTVELLARHLSAESNGSGVAHMLSGEMTRALDEIEKLSKK
jgi:acyl carrier protein